MKKYWQDSSGEKMRSSSKSSDVVLAGNPLHSESDNFGPAKFTTEMTSRSAAPWKKKKGDPFQQGVAPVSDPAIPPTVWRTWWKLYAEQGSIKWTRSFDFTQARARARNARTALSP